MRDAWDLARCALKIVAVVMVIGVLWCCTRAEAGSQTYYYWLAQDGTPYYTDNIKKVPKMYLQGVEARDHHPLGEYERYSYPLAPTDERRDKRHRSERGASGNPR